MRYAFTFLALLATITSTANAQAQGPASLAQLRDTELQAAGEIELYKDPLVATYLSATLPGLGQFYAGHKKRGVLFLASIVGAFGSAYAFYEPARLTLADYDDASFGGNGDGLLSTTEVQNWEDHKFEDDALDRLSDGRKAGLLISAAVGLGLYVWNVIDAPKQANAHNRQLVESRVGLDLQAGPDRAGLAFRVRFWKASLTF
jgi:TM2 domain-containing membrane protein YozV